MTPVAGDLLKPFRIANVSPEAMKSWAVFLRDPNPIHLDPKVVMAMGLGDRVINQGPANLAYVISMLQGAFPGSRLETLDVRYVDNAFGGEAVESSGRVTAVERVDGVTKVACEVWLRAETRGPVISGTATIVLPLI
jgi:3-hydroxybutyryl-CoA dehydratase